MSDKPLGAERKAVRKALKAGNDLDDALKRASGALVDIDDKAFEAQVALAEVAKALKGFDGFEAVLSALRTEIPTLTRTATSAAERSKARLVGVLAEQLESRGWPVSGRLPLLKCGPLSLELTTGRRPEVIVWFGPQIEELGRAPMVAEKVVELVADTMASLEPEPLDEPAFLEELHRAWRVAQARLGLESSARVPILSVLTEVAVARQSERWKLDPGAGRFSPYGRVRFAHDLGRLAVRIRGQEELALTVATRDQTRKASDHLWVAGTHYAFLSFREL